MREQSIDGIRKMMKRTLTGIGLCDCIRSGTDQAAFELRIEIAKSE